MAYWLDEGWHGWPEVVRAGTAAAGLYARCGSYVADHTTDGFIPSGVVGMYGTAEWAKRLVEVGLWTVEGDGYRDERYFPLNPTKATVEKRKADAAARQRKRRHGEVTRDSRGTSRVTSRAPARPSTKGRGRAASEDAKALKPHPFNDDGGDNDWCTCGLPRLNKIHPQ